MSGRTVDSKHLIYLALSTVRVCGRTVPIPRLSSRPGLNAYGDRDLAQSATHLSTPGSDLGSSAPGFSVEADDPVPGNMSVGSAQMTRTNKVGRFRLLM